MKKKFAVIAIGFAAVMGICVNALVNQGYDYTTDKVIGSDDSGFIKEEIKDIHQLLDRTDVVVTGKVMDSGRTVRLDESSGDTELDKKYQRLFGKEIMSTFALYSLDVEQVISGDQSLQGTNITICQYGKAGDDSGETKLKKNENVVLLLTAKGDNTYSIVGLENGAFTIELNNTITTHGIDQAVIGYDKKSAKTVIETLKKKHNH